MMNEGAASLSCTTRDKAEFSLSSEIQKEQETVGNI